MFTKWEHIVRDAWTLKAHFPHLDKFEARSRMLKERMGSAFFAEQDDYHNLNELERRQRGEQVAARVASWLDSELGETKPVPPWWLRITFGDEMEANDSDMKFLRFQHEVLKQAHLLLTKKRKLRHEEGEASGRIWLEACSMKRKRGRTGWYDDVDTAHVPPTALY
ncbi:uncharacterized protein yc1106_08630 [Curvularia clavata]|uniref:Uncharacterized protein n=1 Tax=Curvularia clavata TaxID=95742 RepID=A0A9Q8ZDM9_CURCL|nr:uncharacterized protein yc1106_08630 [Curvularia clavata]